MKRKRLKVVRKGTVLEGELPKALTRQGPKWLKTWPKVRLKWAKALDCGLVAIKVVLVAIIVVPMHILGCNQCGPEIGLIAVLTVFDCRPLHIAFILLEKFVERAFRLYEQEPGEPLGDGTKREIPAEIPALWACYSPFAIQSPHYDVDPEGCYLFVRRATRKEILDFASHILESRMRRSETLLNPNEAKLYLSLQLGDLEREVFCCILLDNRPTPCAVTD